MVKHANLANRFFCVKTILCRLNFSFISFPLHFFFTLPYELQAYAVGWNPRSETKLWQRR